jgi:hypothetical protein
VNSDTVYEIEDLLKDLKIEIFESQMISDGDIDYFIFSSSDLNEEQREILHKLKFDEIRYNLFISEEIIYNKNEILDLIVPTYSVKEKTLWNAVLLDMYRLNEKYLVKYDKFLFSFDNDHIIVPLKWNGQLTMNKSELGDFITDLNKLIKSSCKSNWEFMNEKNYNRHIFWSMLSSIRNREAHLSTERGVNGAIDLIKKETESYKVLIDKEAPSQSSPFDFIAVQVNLLEYCKEFLEDIINNLGDYNGNNGQKKS